VFGGNFEGLRADLHPPPPGIGLNPSTLGNGHASL